MEQVYTPSKDYKVLVRCMTYNQSKYIEDALNGFAMQKTDFPFVCLVMDDDSTDGEQEVIKAWMERECDMTSAENIEIEKSFITLVPHKTNSSCTFAFYFLKENLYGTGKKTPLVAPWREHCEYEALCEGDDYWISPVKIQEQYNFLNANNEYLLIGSNGIIQYNDTNLGLRYFNNHFAIRDVSFEELVNNWVFPTASMMYCTSILENYPEWSAQIHFGDDLKVMLASIHGKVATLGTVTCVYRKGVGITKTLDNQLIYMHEQHRLFYSNILNDTGDRYRDILEKRITRDGEEIKFYTLKEKSLLILTLKYPKRCIRMFISHIYRYIKKRYLEND